MIPQDDPAAAAMIKNMWEKMFGPDGKMNVYFTAADKTTIVFGYTTPDAMLKMVESMKKGAAGHTAQKDVQRTAKLLSKGAHVVGFISVDGGIAFINRTMKMFSPEGTPLMTIPAFPSAPPVGFSMQATPEGLEGEMVVPGELLDAIGKYVAELTPKQPLPVE